MKNIPRPEHPFPQMERAEWQNLNGEWDFAFDFGRSGRDRHFYENGKYEGKIVVPFCPESSLSDIGYRDFIPCAWYRRFFGITGEQLRGTVLLHFGAVDYLAVVYVNGRQAGAHRGGYSSFTFDITEYLKAGSNELVVCAEDDNRSGRQPRGKQSAAYASSGCDYTRTTGIWQTVWLEFVPKNYIRSVRYYPDVEGGILNIEASLTGTGKLCVDAYYEGRACGRCEAVVGKTGCGTVRMALQLNEIHLWEAGCGRLYDLEFTFSGEGFCDKVKSYAGLREVRLDGRRFLLNGKPVFQRTVLDQGFYPDGIYTAPTEEALINDIRISIGLGFNGARLHQKIFEPRFLYHCDRMGYLVWGEHGNWGLDLSDPAALHPFMGEWLEAVDRDFNHPSVIGWCPFNETWDFDGRKQYDDTLRLIYRMTKQLYPTRPSIDTSGNFHVETDIYDVHNYTQDAAVFASYYEGLKNGGKFRDDQEPRQHYTEGLPVFVSEYGGIKWDVSNTNASAWGYGEAPKTEEEFLERYRRLTECLLANSNIMGFCYTQLYDIEQEVNGLYTYDRKPKFSPEIIRAINRQPAAIEKEEDAAAADKKP
ncbi:MAG: beta-galactosidase [Lachnospiraceae bacterium]|nr:beta-galactosidase [Lachnospiraceae bacterium]